MAEVRVVRATRDDQRVVLERAPAALSGDRADLEAVTVEVEVRDLPQDHPDVGTSPEDGAQRIADLAGRERAGGDLVGERLEQVEVAPVHQGELHWRGGQVGGGLEAADPPPTTITLCALRDTATRREAERGFMYPMLAAWRRRSTRRADRPTRGPDRR